MRNSKSRTCEDFLHVSVSTHEYYDLIYSLEKSYEEMWNKCKGLFLFISSLFFHYLMPFKCLISYIFSLIFSVSFDFLFFSSAISTKVTNPVKECLKHYCLYQNGLCINFELWTNKIWRFTYLLLSALHSSGYWGNQREEPILFS